MMIIVFFEQQLKNNIYFKREDTQPVFSFKIRGAYNKMTHLTQAELDRGVVCCSAGNHAQGVALSARMLGCRAIIVMPLATPSIKVNSVRNHGGPTVEVRLFGNTYDDAAVEAKRLQVDEKLTFVHPFDDPHVIAGQGTIGMEILKQSVGRPLDIIFVCCGGGGLLAGIAAYVKVSSAFRLFVTPQDVSKPVKSMNKQQATHAIAYTSITASKT
jgi:threonine dehydratase